VKGTRNIAKSKVNTGTKGLFLSSLLRLNNCCGLISTLQVLRLVLKSLHTPKWSRALPENRHLVRWLAFVSRRRVLSTTSTAIKPQAAPLTQLPYDMIWEILAYYPTIPNWEVVRNQAVLNSKYLQRYQVLRALSQTCRALRFQCHPHLWEHVQACLLKESGRYGSFYRQVGEALQKQSQILASALPELQPLVRCARSQLDPLMY